MGSILNLGDELFSFPRSGNRLKREVQFPYSIHIPENWTLRAEWIVFTLGSLCLPCYAEKNLFKKKQKKVTVLKEGQNLALGPLVKLSDGLD